MQQSRFDPSYGTVVTRPFLALGSNAFQTIAVPVAASMAKKSLLDYLWIQTVNRTLRQTLYALYRRSRIMSQVLEQREKTLRFHHRGLVLRPRDAGACHRRTAYRRSFAMCMDRMWSAATCMSINRIHTQAIHTRDIGDQNSLKF